MNTLSLLPLRAFALGMTLAVAAMAAPLETTVASPCELLVARVRLDDPARIAEIASWTEPWEVSRDGRTLVLGLRTGGLDRLMAAGFDFEIDFDRTQEACAPPVRLPGQTLGIPGYPCYRTVEETFALAEQMTLDHPALASWIDIGDSWEKVSSGGAPGYDLRVLRLTNSAVAGTPVGSGGQLGKPRLFVTTTIHAREYAPPEIAARFAELLLANHGLDPDITWLLDEHEIHLLLYANPDGRKHAEGGDLWRKNTNETYCSPTSSSRGADLNRNFSFQWACCGGSSPNPCDDTYRGPSPVSEPETAAIESYARAIFPDQRGPDLSDPAPLDATGIFLDIHSSGELVLWPWGFVAATAPNATGLQALGRRMAWLNGYWPEQSIGLYPVDGATDDFHYGELGVASYTLEVGTSFFQSCSTFENELLPANIAALLYAAKVARTPYLTAHGPSVLDLRSPSGTFVAQGDSLEILATADDSVFSAANGTEPIQSITAAEALLDVPPWESPPPAIVIPLAPADGIFDAPTEGIEGLLDTSGLAEGRHALYVHSQDGSGAWGPVSALFFWILDPATAGRIEGEVLEAGTLAPLAAVVDVEITSTTSDPSDGSYQLLLPPDVYDVTATAAGYESAAEVGVVASSGGTTMTDFLLPRLPGEASCDAETGPEGWTGEAPWAITTESAHGGTHAWSDSPDGNYASGASVSLLSPILNLSEVQGVQLSFWHRYQFEATYDFGRVEISIDGGQSWEIVTSYDGDHLASWEEVVLDLPALDGVVEARVRFRVDTDNTIVEDGWYLDDLVLGGFMDEQAIFGDGFESGDTGAWTATSP